MYSLRAATANDAAALADLGARAFVAAFGTMYRPEDLAAFLAESHAAERVTREIADPGMRVQVAVAEDGALLAFCKLSLASTLGGHSPARRPLELKQLYADPARTGGGIGAALMDWALAEARAAGADEIQLSVWSGNTRAQAFYRRYGFDKIADITFRVGEQLDEEFLFARPLP